MPDHYIKGSSETYRPGGGDASLPASRFLVTVGGPHTTLGFSGTDNHPIIWDPTPEYDFIGGFPDDYFTSGSGQFFFAAAGVYRITAWAEVEADAAFTAGWIMVDIETGVSPNNPSQPSEILPDRNPRTGISDEFQFAANTSMEIHVYTIGCDDTSTVARASVTITKLR